MEYKTPKNVRWFILGLVFMFAIGVFIVSSTEKVEFLHSPVVDDTEADDLDVDIATSTEARLEDDQVEASFSATSSEDVAEQVFWETY